jgi:hypothetical protein
MEEDLGLEGDDYQIAVSLLFVTYVMCEVPSNLIIKRLRPSRYIAFITVSWGIVATLTGVVQSFGGLIAVRLILGALEAGLFPGMAIYLVRHMASLGFAWLILLLDVVLYQEGTCSASRLLVRVCSDCWKLWRSLSIRYRSSRWYRWAERMEMDNDHRGMHVPDQHSLLPQI